MSHRCVPLVLILVGMLPSWTLAQPPTPEAAAARMRPAAGLRVDVAAAEPAIRQPVTMSFDAKGRLWVVQYLQYPNPAGLKPVKVDEYLRTVYGRIPEPPPRGPQGADKITILYDADAAGRFRQAKDFVTGLNLASGMALAPQGVYVLQAPYLLYYADADGDDRPDGPPQVLLSGFGMEDSHAVANSLIWGPDGWLYGAQGSTVTAKIACPVTKRVHEFQQGVWRYHPRTQRFELFAEGGGNTWGLDFDAQGELIAGTNWGGHAALHMVQGGYYVKGFAKHGPLHHPFAFGYFEHVPCEGFRGAHVTCGGIVYQGHGLPESHRGRYLACNLLDRNVYAYSFARAGSTYTMRHEGALLEGNDPWFRPVDLQTGPDGAVYVADWCDLRANHVDPVDNWDKAHGRIFRLANTTAKVAAAPDLTALHAVDLLECLNHPNAWQREWARLLLAQRFAEGRGRTVQHALRERLTAMDGDHVLTAMWALASGDALSETELVALARHRHPPVRTWAVRLLGDRANVSPEAVATLQQLAAEDREPGVVRQLASTARRLHNGAGLAIVRALIANPAAAEDRMVPLLTWWALEGQRADLPAKVLLAVLGAGEATTWKGRLWNDVLWPRLARLCLADERVPKDLAVALLETAKRHASPGTLNQGLASMAAVARPGRHDDLLTALSKLPPSPELGAMLELKTRLGDPAAQAECALIVASPERADAERLAVLRFWTPHEPRTLAALLEWFRRTPNESTRLQLLDTLAATPGREVAETMLAFWPRASAAVRAKSLNVLVGRREWAAQLVAAVQAGQIPASALTIEHAQRLKELGDPAIDRMVGKHWGGLQPRSTGEKQARIRSLVHMCNQAKGDPAAGQTLFHKHCGTCHQFFGAGTKIGPDLTAADRTNRTYLATHIVDPSLHVRPEFQTYSILTKDGRLLTALILAEDGDTLTLADRQGNKSTLNRQQIEELKPSPQSLMPEQLLDPLTDQQIRDLFAYLQAPAPPPAAPPTPAPTKRLTVCLVSGSFEYESDKSLAVLGKYLERHHGMQVTWAKAPNENEIQGLENLDTCDVAVLFTRRLRITGEALERVKKFARSGKPLVALRTASHGFQNDLAFDQEVLGGNYRNHFGKGPKTQMRIEAAGKEHPILRDVVPFASEGALYRNTGLAADCQVLLTGILPGQAEEPIAWTRRVHGGRLFYTSLGHQSDFKEPAFLRMLANAILWVHERDDMVPSPPRAKPQETLPGTAPWSFEGDPAAAMVAGMDRFLLQQIEQAAAGREKYWQRDGASPEAYHASLEPNRQRLRRLIGMVDPRPTQPTLEVISTPGRPTAIAKGEGFDIFAVRWRAFSHVDGEGLLLVPVGKPPVAHIVAVPDADQTPEQIVGLTAGVPRASQFARRLAEAGCQVLVPLVVDRRATYSGIPGVRMTNQPHREWIYRQAFEVGRHIIGYEVQKILAAVDWFAASAQGQAKIGVYGYGEGGLLALYAGALDGRIHGVGVAGYFGPREGLWEEPIYRNVWGLLTEFGDAELAAMVHPRLLVIDGAAGPEVAGPPPPSAGRGGAAPGRLTMNELAQRCRHELERLERLPVRGGKLARPRAAFLAEGAYGDASAATFIETLSAAEVVWKNGAAPTWTGAIPDHESRCKRQFDQLVEHTQALMRESEYTRRQYLAKADRAARSVAAWQATTRPYREAFETEVIGKLDLPLSPAQARTRRIFDEPKYTGYEVMLDVFAPDVFACGYLLVPKDLRPGEKRPVVVCQHGLEGRPRDVADPKVNNPAYHQYGCRLAERGYVVFAPQNPYIFGDRFRTLQRKANPLGKSLFALIVPQHRQITEWLAGLPFVDGDRIAFYGLSYGGKTAMRVPAVVERYGLSICSADFNEWIWKNTSARSPYSYLITGEYEIFEWNLANTFNYAEMAGLIAPRPFMVERGHRDGVAPDEWVAYEFAKVKQLYVDLKIGERAEIEFFDGPHTIHGVGTFRFLDKWLRGAP
jgi:putative membrane-bound dehydrogenase-like protein